MASLLQEGICGGVLGVWVVSLRHSQANPLLATPYLENLLMEMRLVTYQLRSVTTLDLLPEESTFMITRFLVPAGF